MKNSHRIRENAVDLEESLSEEWQKDFGLVEVPLSNKPLVYWSALIFIIGLIVIGRIFYLGVLKSEIYVSRAEANLNQVEILPAPRGLIYDRSGKILAENLPVFSAVLDVNEFLHKPDLQKETFEAINDILGLTADEVWSEIEKNDVGSGNNLIVLRTNLSQERAVKLKGLDLPALVGEDGFIRRYAAGEVFSSVIGYTGFVSAADLAASPELRGDEIIGKAGAELFYNDLLKGEAGRIVQKRDARGRPIGDKEITTPQTGKSLQLTIDADFQKYFYQRLKTGLDFLGRTKGVGLALNPQNGEVLAMVSFPVFDNNILGGSGRNEEKQRILNSSDQPLFNRAIGGFYNPGSTIKPLAGVAALKEGVITPTVKIFSPGYLDIPNPYNPDSPTRFLDWREQGWVDLSAAIAQSSNVYFYEVGGGGPDLKPGLGISRLREWWQKFGLGNLTGIDLPGEAKGFLPSPDWKEKKTSKPWLLGDTYNVSIGQGDLLLTPIQLLNYISAIANGGKIYQPRINKDSQPKILTDLSSFESQFQEVRRGMRQAVTSPLGTANLLADLGFPVEAKTGSAQIMSNQQENAFFVGYAPADNPQIAILVLVENSREGSLNAVPIAKDVLNWYYWNRIKTYQH